ncbi:MAG: hypothetical protein K2G75_02280, partial [Muribaculaceae bacterium]|nr:hypothetical protein [Muribaculaceae bacterium]
MLKRTSILLLPLVCSLTALNARTIRGVVVASSDSTAVAGANCRLFAGDRLIGGASADEAGAFIVDTDDKSALNLEISMVGFSP